MNQEYKKIIDEVLFGMLPEYVHPFKENNKYAYGYMFRNVTEAPNYIKLTVECDRNTDVQEVVNRLTENERIALFNVAIIKSTKGLVKYNMVVKALLYDDVLKTAYDIIDNDKKNLELLMYSK